MKEKSLKIFIGSGEKSILECKTLIYSLHKHTNSKLDIHIFNGTRNTIEYNNQEIFLEPLPSRLKCVSSDTEFMPYRFLVSQVCNYQGKAIYLDSDIVCLTDISKLFDISLHNYDFIALANAYPKIGEDLWRTSVQLIDCEKCKFPLEKIFDEIDNNIYSFDNFLQLSPIFLAHYPFKIGSLDPTWNELDQWYSNTKMIHYTALNTQPWKYPNHPYEHIWFQYFHEAITAGYISDYDINTSINKSYVRKDILHKKILNQ
jgi:Glycosyl transferase family 8